MFSTSNTDSIAPAAAATAAGDDDELWNVLWQTILLQSENYKNE